MKLKDWLTENEVSPMEMGQRLGLKQANSIYRWLRGELKPSADFMTKIAEMTGGQVMPNDFFTLPALPKAEEIKRGTIRAKAGQSKAIQP